MYQDDIFADDHLMPAFAPKALWAQKNSPLDQLSGGLMGIVVLDRTGF
ncbi:hypothetical protein [Iodidimonas gelatinilytica]|nr:hypothetical protein [Iodidimonas gelatinilytica]